MFEKGIQLKPKKMKSITTIVVLGLFSFFKMRTKKISIEKAIETAIQTI
jgi:cobalt-zinc-cadmium resistance protein CzcA